MYSLKSKIWSIVLLLTDSLISLFYKQKVSGAKDIQKVLIIRLDAIGDSIIWLDSAKEFRKLYPSSHYELTLLCNQVWLPIAKQLPYFDNVLSLHKKKFHRNLVYRSKIFKKIISSNFDIGIHPTFSREFHYGDSLIRICKAKQRIGSIGNMSNITHFLKGISDKWYTKLISSNSEPLMELDRNTEFMRGLGLENFQSSIPVWPIKIDYHKPTTNNYFVIFPGASNKKRAWPSKYFSEIIEKLQLRTGWTAVICGGPGEEDIGKEIKCHSKENTVILDLIGKTTIIELGEVIRNSKLLIGNETSAIHLAAAVKVPSVCILGGGHYGRFIPYSIDDYFTPKAVINKMNCFNCNWHCTHEKYNKSIWPCISNVTINEVWKEVLRIIEKGEDRHENKSNV
ncbi:glycosyltransferase family 9 protein [Halalkalibacterium ligniniphilum]|uniref:glycosyltransferase family 9 protein n=1 Tax=Halalkalibacterium ligniniphilum TaxID=1134413 RepID=UPI0003451C90|nr:glycosyltransferase family 9 protein [Halalkalibacterium ligniniphilum]